MAQNIGPVALVLAAAFGLAACDGSPGSSTAPSPPSPPVPGPGPGAGQIRMLAVSPSSGATVRVRDCTEGGWQAICTDQLQMAFEVVVDRDVPDAALTIGFHDGAVECGRTPSLPAAMAAGIPRTLHASRVNVSYQLSEGGPATTVQPCAIPSTTTRIVASLWRPGDPRAPLVTAEFTGVYTFAR